MEYLELGKTGLRVSALGFGCGNVGGLMIRGTAAERERAIARAVELGINYFDTAPSYGDGQSEQNLGAAVRSLRASVYVGTKFRLDAADLGAVPGAVSRSLDASLKRLRREHVDLLQLHNNIFAERAGEPVSVADVLDRVIPALQALQGQGYGSDGHRAQALRALIEEGHVGSLVEASLRFALSSQAVSTVLLGYSSLEHLEYAAAAVAKGPLPAAALDRLSTVWARFGRGAASGGSA